MKRLREAAQAEMGRDGRRTHRRTLAGGIVRAVLTELRTVNDRAAGGLVDLSDAAGTSDEVIGRIPYEPATA